MKLENFVPFIRHKKTVVSHHTYGLTPLGKTKTEEFSATGPKWEVMAMLNENGPSSPREISDETKISIDKVKAILRMLVASGYVRRVNHEEE